MYQGTVQPFPWTEKKVEKIIQETSIQPYWYRWDETNKLVIMGQVDSPIQEDSNGRFFTLQTQAAGGEEASFRVYFREGADTVLLLHRPDWKRQPVEEWRGISLEEASQMIQPGQEIQVHLSIDQSVAQNISAGQDLKPISRMIVPE